MATTDPGKKLSGKEKQRLRAERAAELLREKQRRERRRQVLTVVGVVLAILLIVGGGFLVNSLRDDTADSAASVGDAGSDHALAIGPASAPHEVVVYEDFLCPICGEFEAAGHEQLEALADEGKVRVEYRPFVLLDRMGPYSETATAVWSQVLEHDGPDVALAFHDALFADQPNESGPFPSEQDLVDLAGQSGADTDALQAALDDGDGEAWAQAATKSALAHEVRSTPTVFLDGTLFTDYRTPDDLAQNLIAAVQ